MSLTRKLRLDYYSTCYIVIEKLVEYKVQEIEVEIHNVLYMRVQSDSPHRKRSCRDQSLAHQGKMIVLGPSK
jgi:hypothetical protein